MHPSLILVYPILFRIWTTCDLDGDGMLTLEEFALGMFLINEKLLGRDLPKELPAFLIPPIAASISAPAKPDEEDEAEAEARAAEEAKDV